MTRRQGTTGTTVPLGTRTADTVKRAARSTYRRVSRVTGLELRRAATGPRWTASKPTAPARTKPGDRLLVAPAFILSSVRSGSTLLRVLLNSHSRIHAPQELHLDGLQVVLNDSYVTRAMASLGSDADELQYLLWDRLLQRELLRHSKSVLVNKTPSDALMWERLVECWPDARFIFLLRHPAAVIDSWNQARPYWSRERTAQDVLRYMSAMEQARSAHGGITVRYEQLTADPEAQTRRICGFLGLPWERRMLDYGSRDHGTFAAGLGDWGERIQSGQILPAQPPSDVAALPPALGAIATSWGYDTSGGDR